MRKYCSCIIKLRKTIKGWQTSNVPPFYKFLLSQKYYVIIDLIRDLLRTIFWIVNNRDVAYVLPV